MLQVIDEPLGVVQHLGCARPLGPEAKEPPEKTGDCHLASVTWPPGDTFGTL